MDVMPARSEVRGPILVTGATGFIGGRLVRVLLHAGHDVTCLVQPGERHDLANLPVRLVEGDLRDPGALRAAVRGARVVYHAAALLKVPWKPEFVSTNVGGTAALAEACARSPEAPTLVTISSLIVGGAVGPLEAPLHEARPPRPISRYGRMKLACEQAAGAWAGEVPITVVRPPAAFGEGDPNHLPLFGMVRRGWLPVPVPRHQRFSVIDVDDLGRALLRAATHGERLPAPTADASPGQGVYYVAGDETVTFAELGRLVAAAMGRDGPRVVHLPSCLAPLLGVAGEVIGRVTGRPARINVDKIREATAGSWVCTTDKARAGLDFHPTSRLGDSLCRATRWYRAHGLLPR